MASIDELANKAGEAFSNAKPVVEGAVAAGAEKAAQFAKGADEWARGDHPVMEGAYESVGKAGEGFLDAVAGAANAAYEFLKDRADEVSGQDLDADGVVAGIEKVLARK